MWDSEASRQFAQVLVNLYNVTQQEGGPTVTADEWQDMFLDPKAHKAFTKV